MNKRFERYGYTALVNDNVLTIENPHGLVIKYTKYKNHEAAKSAWYGWCARRNMRVRSKIQDTVTVETKESTTVETPQIINKVANSLPITAIIDFNFSNNQNLPLADWIKDITERINAADFTLSEIVRVRLVPNT